MGGFFYRRPQRSKKDNYSKMRVSSKMGILRRWGVLSRGQIPIFEPIFKVEDRAENPDLSIAERAVGRWSRERVGRTRRLGRGVLRSFGREGGRREDFLSSGPEDRTGGSSFFGPGRSKTPCHLRITPPSSSKNSHPPPPLRLSSDLRPIRCPEDLRPPIIFDLRSRKIEDSPFFVLRPRRSKNPPPSSFFDPEDRRTPIYDLRSRRFRRRSPSAPW